jgi:plasmid stabilization system protein ParE
MRLRLSPRAAQDLSDIGDYIRVRNPQAAVRVRADILAALQMVQRSPRLGRAQTVEGVRKIVTRRYSYIVYYNVDDAAREIGVLTILHPARERPYSDL